jgi:hypothetical protein
MRPLPSNRDGIKPYGAMGRAWFYVHRDKCADVVESVTRVGFMAIISGGRSLFAQRAPILSGVVEEYARKRREGIQ